MLKCGMSGSQVKGGAAFLPFLQRKRESLRVTGAFRHHRILNPLLLCIRAEDTKSGHNQPPIPMVLLVSEGKMKARVL